mgnify:CR=1 FL=1
MRGTILVISVLGLLLGVAAAIGYWSWRALDGVEIGFHGYVALGLGAGLSVLLWVGLMSLVFYSSRRGYDDEAGRD